MRSVFDCITNVPTNIIQEESAKNTLLEFVSNKRLPGLVSYLVYESGHEKGCSDIRMLTAYYVPLCCLSRIRKGASTCSWLRPSWTLQYRRRIIHRSSCALLGDFLRARGRLQSCLPNHLSALASKLTANSFPTIVAQRYKLTNV